MRAQTPQLTWEQQDSRPGLEPYIGYLRVSTWREEKISPELQRTAIEAWARRTGRRIVAWIVDLDMTGRNFKRKIMKGIEAVERREANGIAVWKYNRFGRNDLGIAINLARLEKIGGQLQSATEEIDASTAVGKFNRSILFDLAVFESDRAGEQWKEAHAHRRALQLPATGRPRFGYIWHPRRIPDLDRPGEWKLQEEWYQVDEPHAPYVDNAYERKVNGTGFNNLVHWYNGLGFRTSRGGLWYVSSLSRYMDSGFAAGLLRIHDPDCKCAFTENNGCVNNRWVYIPGAHEPLIAWDLWEAYLEHRQETKKTPPRARKATYTLTGLTAHALCRHHLSHASDSDGAGKSTPGHYLVCGQHKHGRRQICPTNINARRVDVEEEVRRWLEREAAAGIDAAPATEPAPAVVNERAAAARERAHLQAELSKIEKALDRLVTDYALDPDKYPDDSFARVRDQFTSKKTSLTAALSKIAEVESAPTAEDFHPIVVGLAQEWDTILVQEKNALLKQIVRRVAVGYADDGKKRNRGIVVEVHAVWKPDPWAPKEICRGPFGTRPHWSPDDLWKRPAVSDNALVALAS
ncbi:recombinase family protein [Streptomyces sp. VNUA116]|uniref:recombinase family protein n=1 Tax=Streptomyces sp. VNUA116 TaxID=3062449 RepID=UPI0026752ACE|nr:recombinase family protein [Streptomyces sp. VNUA116]WKU46002.1 recombinase family protein [Streptomyces sp. VNUA116]